MAKCRLINGQMGVAKYFKTVDNADNVDKFYDPEADRKLIGVKGNFQTK